MKLGSSVLLEIMNILQQGLLSGKDISQALRNIELEIDPDKEEVRLTEQYLLKTLKKKD